MSCNGQRSSCASRVPPRTFGRIPACARLDTTGCIFAHACRLPSRARVSAGDACAWGRQDPLFRPVKVCCSGNRNSQLPLLIYVGSNPSRGIYPAAYFVKADLFLRPHGGIVHWSVLLLRNLQSLGNEPEHLAQHLPFLNFSETYLPSPCLPAIDGRSCPSSVGCLPVGSYLFIGPSYLLFVNNIS